MPPLKPNLKELRLPPGWRHFSHPPQHPWLYQPAHPFQVLQKLPTNGDPAVNLVLDNSNPKGNSWIHPWTGGDLRRHGVKVLDQSFRMAEVHAVVPQLAVNPEFLNDWLEAKINGWAQRELERQRQEQPE